MVITEVIEQTGLGSHRSVSLTRIVTGSSFLFGGRRTFGDATIDAITGGTSVTVTEVAHVLVLPEPSVAVQLTGVVPKPKVDPDGGTQTAVTPGQLSEKVGVIVAGAPPGPVQAMLCGAGHVMLGF